MSFWKLYFSFTWHIIGKTSVPAAGGIGRREGITLEVQEQTLLDKHYLRKHGANAYYGQN